ncbi:MAG: ester cyclase [Bacteroidota bacterium]
MSSLFACQSQPAASHKSPDKEELIQAFYQSFDTGDEKMLAQVLSPSFKDHERVPPYEVSDYTNMIEAAKRIQAGFANPKHQRLQTHYLAGDKVMVYWEFSGIHTGYLAGFAPPDQAITFKGIDIFQITNGKIAEIWHVEALHKLLKALKDSEQESS